jgi:hypothetical protein
MSIDVIFPGFFPVEIIFGIKILDLTGKAGFEFRGIKPRYRARTADTIDQSFPVFFSGIAYRG